MNGVAYYLAVRYSYPRSSIVVYSAPLLNRVKERRNITKDKRLVSIIMSAGILCRL